MRQLAFHANLFQIHGGGLSRGALLNFMDVSGIKALIHAPVAAPEVVQLVLDFSLDGAGRSAALPDTYGLSLEELRA